MYDSIAVAGNLPHEDLNKYIPFRSDDDVCTVLDDAGLNNALFSKVMREWSFRNGKTLTRTCTGYRAPSGQPELRQQLHEPDVFRGIP